MTVPLVSTTHESRFVVPSRRTSDELDTRGSSTDNSGIDCIVTHHHVSKVWFITTTKVLLDRNGRGTQVSSTPVTTNRPSSRLRSVPSATSSVNVLRTCGAVGVKTVIVTPIPTTIWSYPSSTGVSPAFGTSSLTD